MSAQYEDLSFIASDLKCSNVVWPLYFGPLHRTTQGLLCA